MPRWAQSIRFRLSLTYSLLVFTLGSVMVGGLYLWQARQLEEPSVSGRAVVIVDPRTGATTPTPWLVLTGDEQRMQALQRFERAVNERVLRDLRRGSLVAVAGVAVTSFVVGWLLAGQALRPVGRISAFARHLSGTDLSRRVAMQGPDDELKELADTFDGMLDRLQEAFEAQRRFVHEASHELRNPLSVARANLELALDTPDDDPAALRRTVAVAHRATGRMSTLVDDLLTSARMEAPSAEAAPLDAAALVREVVADFSAPAAARPLRLEARVAAPVEVTGDVGALRRALANLVVNAVRLAPEGSTVTVGARRDGADAVLWVADEGPGIPHDQQPMVFERFWRSPDTRRDARGSGLGLTIVRQIARRHGGEVTVDSEVGTGSTFEVRIPAGGRP